MMLLVIFFHIAEEKHFTYLVPTYFKFLIHFFKTFFNNIYLTCHAHNSRQAKQKKKS